MINGKPLIKQNVKITWETEDSAFAIVFSKIINNRYAWVLRPHPDSTPTGKIPNSIKILVRAASNYPRSYKTEETFEIPFVSFFKVNYPSRNINFYSDERFKSIEVISNTDFSVYIEGNSDLINYRIQEKDYQNHYEIQFSIPSSVHEEFKDLKVRISNSLAESSETFFVSYFSNKRSSYSHEDNSQKFYEPSREPESKPVKPSKGSSIASIGILLIVLLGFLIFGVYFCWIKAEPGYEHSDSSFIDSDSKKKYSDSDKKKPSNLRSHGRYPTRN